MTTWRDEQHVEVVEMFPSVKRTALPAQVPACGWVMPEIDPDHDDPFILCGHEYQLNRYCNKVNKHPGAHSWKLSDCNRPKGHDGDHQVIRLTRSGFEALAVWPQ